MTSKAPPCPRCGESAPDEKYRRGIAWMVCPKCNVVYPWYETEPKQLVVETEPTEYQIEHGKDSLTLLSQPYGLWAGWGRKSLWCASILGHLGWIAIIAVGICSVFLVKYLPEQMIFPALVADFFLFAFALIFYYDYLTRWRWGRCRYVFAPQGFKYTESNLLLRSTTRFPRSEMIAIQVNEVRDIHYVRIQRPSYDVAISLEKPEEASRLAAEIEHFYRSHPVESIPKDRQETQWLMDRLFSGERPSYEIHCPACGERFNFTEDKFYCDPVDCNNCSKWYQAADGIAAPPNPVLHEPKWNDKCRVVIRSPDVIEIRAKKNRFWHLVANYIIFLPAAVILPIMGCLMLSMPFLDVPQLAPQFHVSDLFIVIVQLIYVPFGLLLLYLFYRLVILFIEHIRFEWKLTVTSEEIAYSFGSFKKTERRIPLLQGLRFVPRNAWKRRAEVVLDDPATSEQFAVTIRVDEGFFAELPCQDVAEVQRLQKILTDFVADKKFKEPTEENLSQLKYKPVEKTSEPPPPSGSMQTLDFLGKYFEAWTEAFDHEQCVVLLSQALLAVKEDFFDCPEIVEACDCWLASRPVFDLDKVEVMQRLSHEADLVYLQLEDEGKDESQWMSYFNRMCIFNGLAGLYGVRWFDRGSIFGILHDFGHGTPDMDDFTRRVQIRTVHEIGYNLRVARFDSDDDKTVRPILRNELMAFVENTPSFQLEENRLYWCPEDGLKQKSEHWFLYDEATGILEQRVFEDEIEVMVEIAEAFDAKIVGETGEIYCPDGIVLDEVQESSQWHKIWDRLRGIRRQGKWVGQRHWKGRPPIYFYKHFD